jgi:hypothetical protein
MTNTWKNRWLPWWIAGYAALVAAVVGSMFWARQSVLSGATPESISDWQTWRSDVQQKQTQTGQSERRVPKSDEPPALVLMRDYFGVLMVGAILFTSMLYGVIAWFVTGIMRGPHQTSNIPTSDI